MSLVVLIAALVVIVFVCIVFVFHPDYESGVVGTVGLAVLALAAASRADDVIGRLVDAGSLADAPAVPPRALIAWVGAALFFGQLAYRFLRRCWQSDGDTSNRRRRALDRRQSKVRL